MRICIFSDTHGNVVALDAVLADMRRRDRFDLMVMAGDLAQFGPRPAETVDRIRELGCPVLTGNTDQYIVANEKGWHDWVREQLGAERIAYLAGLPFSYSVEPAADHPLHIFHANPHDLEGQLRYDRPESEVRELIAGVRADVLAFGHIHTPYIRHVDDHVLFDIASVGLPRDGDTRAAYGIAEWSGGNWRLEHVRVPYDVEAVAADLRARNVADAEKNIQTLRSASY
jgi:putative phosphoesterase